MNTIMTVNSTDSHIHYTLWQVRHVSYRQVLSAVAFLSSAISYTCSGFLTIEKSS